MLLDPAGPGSIHRVPDIFLEDRIVNFAELNQWCCLEESGQWLENVNRAHLELATGKLALQNTQSQRNENTAGLEGLGKGHLTETRGRLK